jgi:hypothetical protein
VARVSNCILHSVLQMIVLAGNVDGWVIILCITSP